MGLELIKTSLTGSGIGIVPTPHTQGSPPPLYPRKCGCCWGAAAEQQPHFLGYREGWGSWYGWGGVIPSILGYRGGGDPNESAPSARPVLGPLVAHGRFWESGLLGLAVAAGANACTPADTGIRVVAACTPTIATAATARTPAVLGIRSIGASWG